MSEVNTRYTNHSLRATSTTRLFASNVPERVIQEKTGHRSMAGLRAYERTTVEQEMNATRILGSVDTDIPRPIKLPVIEPVSGPEDFRSKRNKCRERR